VTEIPSVASLTVISTGEDILFAQFEFNPLRRYPIIDVGPEDSSLLIPTDR